MKLFDWIPTPVEVIAFIECHIIDHARKEYREVEVTEVFDYDRGHVELVDDAGHVWNERAMDVKERQGVLPI